MNYSQQQIEIFEEQNRLMEDYNAAIDTDAETIAEPPLSKQELAALSRYNEWKLENSLNNYL